MKFNGHTQIGMKGATVSDPEGANWRVEVRWLPWVPRWRGPRRRRKEKDPGDPRWYDWLDIGEPFAWFDEGLGGFVAAIVLMVLLVVAILFVLPAFIFLVELLIIVVVVLGAVAIRVLFRRPWIVDASPADDKTSHLVWKVVGTSRAREAVDLIAQQLAAGIDVPQVPEGELVQQPTESSDPRSRRSSMTQPAPTSSSERGARSPTTGEGEEGRSPS